MKSSAGCQQWPMPMLPLIPTTFPRPVSKSLFGKHFDPCTARWEKTLLHMTAKAVHQYFSTG